MLLRFWGTSSRRCAQSAQAAELQFRQHRYGEGLDRHERISKRVRAGCTAEDHQRLAVTQAALPRITSPALVVNRHWTMIAPNAPVALLMGGVAPELLEPPVNVMRLSLHPSGLAPQIANLGAWKAHAVERLRRQHRATGDNLIEALLSEISSYEYPGRSRDEGEPAHGPASDVAVPLKLRIDAGLLSFLSTTTIFGTAVEITLSELVLDAFYPADQVTGDILRSLT